MRKLDNKRIEEYLKKHVSLKKWVSIMLVVALLVTTATMYSLNKSANALSGDEAEDVGMVLEGDNIEELASGNVESGDTDSIQDSEESESTEGSEEESSESENTEAENSENSETENSESENSDTENSGSENSEESANAEATSEESNSGEASTEESVENNTESTEGSEANAENANSEEGATDQTATGEATDVADASTENSSEDDENTDAATKGDSKKDSNEVELTEDVVLTVSYVTEDGEKIADEKGINLSESLDFTTEAPKQDGYEFKKAEIDGVEINKITAKQDANGHKYYEVTVGKSVTESEETTSNENAVDGEFTDRSATDETLSESTTSEETAAESTSSESETSENTAEELTSEDNSSSDASSSDSSSSEASSEDSASSDTVSEENASNETTEETSSNISLTDAAEGDVVVIKENKTVVLTYAIDAQSDITLTAKYVDKDGKDIKDSEELKITAETELKNAESILVEGYFYLNASIGEQKITKITPVFEDESSDSEETSKKIKEYTVSIVNGEDITITENTDIVLTYVKATEETVFNYSDDKVIVKAEASSKGLFPEGVELKVTEITSATEKYNYDAYLNALNNNAEEIAKNAGQEEALEYSHNNTLMYDIAFMYEGKEIQPKEGTVNVSIEFKSNQLSGDLSAGTQEDIGVVHLPIKEEVKEASEIESTEEATKITAEDIEVKPLSETNAEVGEGEKVEFSENNFSVYAVISYQRHDPGTDTFKSVLGDSVNFGITSYQIFVNESETNFASKIVYANAQTGNDMTNPSEQTFIAAKIDGYFNLKGEKAYFMVPEDSKNNVGHEKGAEYIKLDTSHTSQELEKVIDDMMAYARNASADLAGRTANASIKAVEGKNDRFIVDISSYASGTYYVTVDQDTLGKIGAAERLTIKKKADQTIVFNVTPGGEIYLHKFMVDTDGDVKGSDTLAGTKEDKIARTIIWNFPNAGTVHAGDGVVGVFISGQQYASWANDNTSAGWLVFPSVTLSKEFHNTYDGVKQISGTAQFQAYKNVDNNPSTVKGFKFTIYKKDSNGSWNEIESVKNEDDPQVVTFNSITFGNELDKKNRSNYQYTNIGVGESTEFVYKIQETDGATDNEGNAYTADTTVYYAKVKVTCQKLNEYTDTTFFRVSTPEYYRDESCSSRVNGIPTFNNSTKHGSLGITLYKYLNNGNPGNMKFNFTVKVLKSDGTLETLTDNLTNDDTTISYSFDYDSSRIHKDRHDADHVYLVISENDINNSSSDITVQKDTGHIFVRVDNLGQSNQIINYYKADADNINVKRLYDNGYPDKTTYVLAIAQGEDFKIAPEDYETELAFFNTGSGMLRIHKMVINDFGSDFVRNNTNAALLNNVIFRVTNKETGDYIIVPGFVPTTDRPDRYWKDRATDNNGKHYDVTYNNNAQWTITGIPAGTYTVEEVADGLTLGYDAESNSSYVITTNQLSRVTKYDVTVDSNTGRDSYGTGGKNLRKVYSCDLNNHYDEKVEAHVGGDIETVQVCNYYSIPVGPIKMTKKFIGGTWNKDRTFSFKIEAVSYKAWDSAKQTVTLDKQPLPENTTISVVGDGNNTRTVDFGFIPFRFEGDYTYKITEVQNTVDGVKFDTSVYYVEVQVRKKYTQFIKTYNGGNMANPESYSKNAVHNIKEDFFYLGADIYYRDKAGKTIAVCELTLPEDLDTFENASYNFTEKYSLGSIEAVEFKNTLAGELTIEKKWIDAEGNDIASKRQYVDVEIYQKTKDGDWKLYSTHQLTSENNWVLTVNNLPIVDENGNKYEYRVQEPAEYIQKYIVKYTYGSNTYYAENANEMAGYKMTISDNNDRSYGSVVITNTEKYGYALPSTGGTGKLPFVMLGLGMLIIGAFGFTFLRKKREQ